MFVTWEVSKLDISKLLNLGHNSNILFILVTKSVLKLERFNFFISLQLLNILCISVTCDVSKRLGSIICNFLHDSNIFLILVTKGVWKVDTSKCNNSLQLLNIYSISITWDVMKLFWLNIIDVSFIQDSNIFLIFKTFGVLNE